MIRLLFTSAALLLSACATNVKPETAPAPVTARPTQMPDGQWTGSVRWAATALLEGDRNSGVFEIRISACAGKVEILLTEDGKNHIPIPIGSNVVSGSDLHLFYYLNASDPTDPSWVELQSYSLALRQNETADVMWSRTVNNRHTDSADPQRTFSQAGRGKVTRTEAQCKTERKSG